LVADILILYSSGHHCVSHGQQLNSKGQSSVDNHCSGCEHLMSDPNDSVSEDYFLPASNLTSMGSSNRLVCWESASLPWSHGFMPSLLRWKKGRVHSSQFASIQQLITHNETLVYFAILGLATLWANNTISDPSFERGSMLNLLTLFFTIIFSQALVWDLSF